MGQYESLCINAIFISPTKRHCTAGMLMLQGTTYVVLQLLHNLETAFGLEDVFMLATFGNEALSQLTFRDVPASVQQGNHVVALVSFIAFARGSMKSINKCLTSDGTADLRNELSECPVNDWDYGVRLVVNVFGPIMNKPISTGRHFTNKPSGFENGDVYFKTVTIGAVHIVTACGRLAPAAYECTDKTLLPIALGCFHS